MLEAIQQANLAATVLELAGQFQLVAPPLNGLRLSNEEAVELVDWLQCQPTLNTWRQLSFSNPKRAVRPTGGQRGPRVRAR